MTQPIGVARSGQGRRGVERALVGAAVLVATALGTLTVAPRARAWEASRTAAGLPVRWFARTTPLPFHLGAIAPEDLSPEVAVAVVQTAWDVWAHAGCEDVPTAAYAGTTEDLGITPPTTLRAPPDNLVVFVRTAGDWDALGRGTTEIAVTFVSSNDKTGEIVDTDIAVNDARWRMTIGGSATGDVDFVSTMTHEVGHALGLLHSSDTSATMYATYSSEDPTGARSLEDDDRAGLCATYDHVPDHLSGQRVEGCAGGAASEGLALALAGMAGAGIAVGRRRRRAVRRG